MSTISTTSATSATSTSATSFVTDNLFFDSVVRNQLILLRSQHQLEGQLALKRDELKDEQLSNKAAVQEIFF
ncbi:hypothetical protein RIR_jg27907.t1 [Rhizophagus irregularis DAOM 181602=DAOM 197198]|nr:hypothetical protein RIR_jg27907.t1 [Rhizophagus irregularis DAOM 181602=DAOM 197198]CAG8652485.1 278_t:CDS:2 [Rhizophagus irregularis]